MNNYARIEKSRLAGQIKIPSSKSCAHRAVLAAALAKGTSTVRNMIFSDDLLATLACLQALGAGITRGPGFVRITGIQTPVDGSTLNCRESGSTLRFLLPLPVALGVCATFTGQGRLPKRPLDDYQALLPRFGVTLKGSSLPLTARGQLQPGCYEIRGDISSQYITGLLFALPLLPKQSEIVLTTPLQSRPYVDLTLDCLKRFGVTITPTENGFLIPGGQTFQPTDDTVEGDWSQAAFWIAAGGLMDNILIGGLNPQSLQGDRAILEIARRMGVAAGFQQDGSLLCRPGRLRGITQDATDIPDLVPMIAALAAFAEGKTRITGIGRLRVKESDRVAAVINGLQALGGEASASETELVIQGGRRLSPLREISGCNDHRIVMAFSVIAAAVGGVTVTDAPSVQKSYPAFWEDFRSLGGICNFLNHH